MLYACEHCDYKTDDEKTCLEHEHRCLGASKLAQAISDSIKEGWNPPAFIKIDEWSAGDKKELFSIAKRAIG